jgi:hypothetical protein
MGLLLYKSDEMFSATQLIRQSKMIFDKVLRTSKYRMYHLEKIHSITINGNRMTINVE